MWLTESWELNKNMETIPPVTKLKGDALLELRDINLVINKSKNDLSILEKIKTESENGYQKRIDAVSKREETNSRLEEKFNSVAGNAELYLAKLKIKVSDADIALKKISNKEDKIKNDIKLLEENKLSKIQSLDKDISDRKKFKEGIDKEILKNSSVLDSLKIENKKINAENKAIIERSEAISKQISKRENIVKEKEIKCENTRSELRVWTVRLHKNYGKYITDTEKIILDKYKNI